MVTQTFEIKINAPAARVWHTLWDKKNYSQWTKHFSEGSRMESDWEVHGKTYFLGKDGRGMLATITQLEPNKVVMFEHKAEVKDGKELPESDLMKKYKGNYELYELKEAGDVTKLTVKVFMPKEYMEHMQNGFEKGLEEVRGMAEANNHSVKIL